MQIVRKMMVVGLMVLAGAWAYAVAPQTSQSATTTSSGGQQRTATMQHPSVTQTHQTRQRVSQLRPPTYKCESEEIFDCAQTRGWELPVVGGHSNIVRMFGSAEHAIMYVTTNDGIFALNESAVPGAPSEERMTTCEIAPQLPIRGGVTHGATAIVYAGNQYYRIVEGTVPFADDEQGVSDCVLHLEEIALNTERCAGEIVGMNYDHDVDGDGIADAIGAVGCYEESGAVDDHGYPLMSALHFDVLRGRADGGFDAVQTLGMDYDGTVRLSDSLLKVEMGENTETVRFYMRGALNSAESSDDFTYRCVVDFFEVGHAVALCKNADQDPLGETYAAFDWHKTAPKDKVAVTSEGFCQHPEKSPAGGPTPDATAMDCNAATMFDDYRGPAMAAGVPHINAAGAYLLPKKDGQWSEANFLLSDSAHVLIGKLRYDDGVSSMEDMPKERLTCGSALDGMEWSDEARYMYPHALTVHDSSREGGDELWVSCYRVTPRQEPTVAIFRFANRSEAHTMQLQVAEPVESPSADGYMIDVNVSTEDPSDDHLDLAYSLHDKNGVDVLDYMQERGEFSVDDEGRVRILQHVGEKRFAQQYKAFGSNYVPSLARAHPAEGAQWPLTLGVTACDAVGYCVSDEVQIVSAAKAVVAPSAPAEAPVVAEDLGEEAVVADEAPVTKAIDVGIFSWGMMGGCSLRMPELTRQAPIGYITM